MWSREVWDEICEKAIAFLVLGGVLLNAVLFGGMQNPEFCGFAGLAFLLWLVRLWLNPSQRFLLHPAVWFLLALLGYALWRAPHTTTPYYAHRECLQLAAVVLAFITALQNLHRQDTILWVTHVLVGIGCCIAGYAILQLLRQSDTVLWLQQPAAYVKRAGGTFVNPNDLAGFLAALIPLAMAMVFLGRQPAMVKVLHAYAALVMLGGVAVTMSRGGWIANCAGIGAMLGWMGWRRRNLRLPIAAVGLLLLGGAVLFFSTVDKARARLEEATGGGTINSGLSRPWLWKPAWNMWMDNFWLGVGPAQFDIHFPPYRTPQIQPHPGYVHNDYLNLLTDYGAVGGLLAFGALGMLVWGGVRTAKYAERTGNDLGQRNSNRMAFFFGAAAGLTGLGTHLFFDFVFHIPAISLTAAVVAGLLASNLRFATESVWVTPKLWSRALVTLAGLGILTWFAPVAVRAGRESFQLNKAAYASKVDPALLASLEAAARVAPDNPNTAYQLGENFRRISALGELNWMKQGKAAESWLQKAADLNPLDPDTRLSLARIREWLGDTKAADADFDQALRLGPNSVEIANHVAWHYLVRGRTNEARALFDKSYSWNWWANPMAATFKAQLDQAAAKKL